MADKYPKRNHIERSALNWNIFVSRVYQPDVWSVAAVTEGGRHSDRAARTPLCQVEEGNS